MDSLTFLETLMTFRVSTARFVLPGLAVLAGCAASVEVSDQTEADATSLAQETSPPSESAPVFPDPASVKVTYEAKDCGDLAFAVSDGKSAYTAILDGLEVVKKRGAGSDAIACDLTVHYEFPAGWVFDAPQTIIRAFGQADRYTIGRAGTSVRVGRGTASKSQTFAKPDGENFTIVIDAASAKARAGSVPCGATRADIHVSAWANASGSGSALLQIDSIDGLLNWRRCK